MSQYGEESIECASGNYGRSYPLGASVHPNGVNFSLYSKNADNIELLLFDSVDDSEPSKIVQLDPQKNRTYYYRHICVQEIKPGQIYGFRAFGPYKPELGLRFDPQKLLLDPYGRAVAVPAKYNRLRAGFPGRNIGSAMKSVVVDTSGYDWEGDKPLRHPFSTTVIYEMHVGGFTKHPNSGVSPELRGTYAGVIEKIPYLQDLGITAVELLPIFQFDEQDCPQGLVNYWGYSPVSFFAPHHQYSSKKDHLGVLNEFRDMVKALHKVGIEVILDVVYNHTAEGNHLGPTFCFRGLENRAYYILEKDRSQYANFSGTGNTLNANHSIVRRMILDSLRYWVQEMHIDGFRFDLASILSRDEKGHPLENPPVIWDIESDPILAGTKLIAEAWDAGGLYQVGSFVGDGWKEWNGKFRDDVRSFMKADRGTVMQMASRLLGSPDIYGHAEWEPERSINFVTCHDGFTLNDLVSFNDKHNEANREKNRDGYDHNLSWNCGVEGPSNDPEVERLRKRQIKNFLSVLFLAIGTPMILMGDEVRRTQKGNNNAYCQDNELSWFDWSLVQQHKDIHRFAKSLIQSRVNGESKTGNEFITLNESIRQAEIRWHGVELNRPDWGEDSHVIAVSAANLGGGIMVHVMLNAYWESLLFELPPSVNSTNGWYRWIDTALESPHDISEWNNAPKVSGSTYRVQARSLVALFAGQEVSKTQNQ